MREKGGWEAPPPGHMRKGRSPSSGISDLESCGCRSQSQETADGERLGDVVWGVSVGHPGGEIYLKNSTCVEVRVSIPQTGVQRPWGKTLQERERRGQGEGGKGGGKGD